MGSLINTKILWIILITTKSTFKSEILKCVFLEIFHEFFFIYIKMYKTLSAKYYQEKK